LALKAEVGFRDALERLKIMGCEPPWSEATLFSESEEKLPNHMNS